jgi:hypothetical protein
MPFQKKKIETPSPITVTRQAQKQNVNVHVHMVEKSKKKKRKKRAWSTSTQGGHSSFQNEGGLFSRLRQVVVQSPIVHPPILQDNKEFDKLRSQVEVLSEKADKWNGSAREELIREKVESIPFQDKRVKDMLKRFEDDIAGTPSQPFPPETPSKRTAWFMND